MSMRNKAASGMIWAFLEQIGNKIVQFIIGIILARLLSPSQFGLIGMLTVFISVSESISAGGFAQALIRKEKCTDDDYNTSFIFNIGVGIVLYLLLFSFSGTIATFFNEPLLKRLLAVLAFQIIIDSLSFVQNAKLLKGLEFKKLAQVSVISQTIGGFIGILLAVYGFGVWSLVIKIIFSRLIRSVLLLYFNRWLPKIRFSYSSFKDLFGFGSKMLLVSIIERIYTNIYNIVIGKYYNKTTLGYYTRANQFKSLVSEQLVTTLQRVSLPILSNVQNEKTRLDNGFKKMVNFTFFLSIISMMILIPTARYMIFFLLGAKWSSSITYLQLLALSGILYPVSQVNLNYLQVTGRSDLILRLQVIKKIISVPFIIIGVMKGITFLIYGIIVISISDYLISSSYSAKLGKYSLFQQIQHFIPSTLFLSALSFGIFYLGAFLENSYQVNNGLILLIQLSLYFGIAFLTFYVSKYPEFREILKIIQYIISKKK